MKWDVAVVGGGPAGSVCGAFCAAAGMRVLILERANFPREKVCGDCLNPSCWPILERLQLDQRILSLPHAQITEVEFVGIEGRTIRYTIGQTARGEIAVKRSLFDDLLLKRAVELGAVVQHGVVIDSVEAGWTISGSNRTFQVSHLVAADGRNSTVARLLRILPKTARDRMAVQSHFAGVRNFSNRVSMHFLPHGYGGIASVGNDQINVCLVSTGDRIEELKDWAATKFGRQPESEWRTISPLARSPVMPSHPGLTLIGDAARVVEPFTGEGIYYALASGELAARCLISGDHSGYSRAHRDLYRGRLWVNQLSKQAALHPRMASFALELCRLQPSVLRYLTAKVTRACKAA